MLASFIFHSIMFDNRMLIMKYICFYVLMCMSLSYAQQFYDHSDCSADASYPGSRYTCNSFQDSCKTFLVFRANRHFPTISKISDLLNVNSDTLLGLNALNSSSEVLVPGREVLVPIDCSCSGQFFQANLSYVVSESTSMSEIACGVFEGLVKSFTLLEENPSERKNVEAGSEIRVPLRCGCPDNFASKEGIKYLVTYPFVEGDVTKDLCMKFGISPEDLWEINQLQPQATVFSNTTILVPLRKYPVIEFNKIPGSPPPTPGFLPTITVEKTIRNSKVRDLYIAGSVIGFSLVLVAVLACVLYIKALRKWKNGKRYQSFNAGSSPISCSPAISSPRSGLTGRNSTNSCLSPDLLVGIKFSLFNYSMEEIKRATGDFCEENKIGHQDHKGLMENVKVMIKQMRFEDTRQVIDLHSKLNHINIVKLLGVCYGENDFSWSYLVFELPGNGCLRDCLSNPTNPLQWHQRAQIAFDIATGLHYLHCCIFPSYAHMNIHTRNIFVTTKCRAKLGDIGTTPVGGSSEGNHTNTRSIRRAAPEYLQHVTASEKADIFAFGIVLLELISAREDNDGKTFKEMIGFLGGGATEGGCFEQLRSIMDPSLNDGYSLAEALCLAVLAKSCLEDDPLHRPSMEDIIKVLARMI